jgi:hypothetical protein
VTDDSNRNDRADPMALKQRDLGLLESEVAQRLPASRIPARFAYVGLDGSPRVPSTWFHWTGEMLAMPTFIAAPHIDMTRLPRPTSLFCITSAN